MANDKAEQYIAWLNRMSAASFRKAREKHGDERVSCEAWGEALECAEYAFKQLLSGQAEQQLSEIRGERVEIE